jgi:hypothetical protein
VSAQWLLSGQIAQWSDLAIGDRRESIARTTPFISECDLDLDTNGRREPASRSRTAIGFSLRSRSATSGPQFGVVRLLGCRSPNMTARYYAVAEADLRAMATNCALGDRFIGRNRNGKPYSHGTRDRPVIHPHTVLGYGSISGDALAGDEPLAAGIRWCGKRPKAPGGCARRPRVSVMPDWHGS